MSVRFNYPVMVVRPYQLFCIVCSLGEGETGPECNPGDANNDLLVSADDYASVQGAFGNTGAIGIPGDANCDGDCNVGDAVYIINYVFKGGPEPC